MKVNLYKKPNTLYAVNIIMYALHCVCVCVCVCVCARARARVVLHNEQNISFVYLQNSMKQCNNFINMKDLLNLNRSHNTLFSMT